MPNLIRNLPNAEYHAAPGYSKSTLDLVHESIAQVEWSRKAPRFQSDVADIGTATHAALLEPEIFESEYIREPSFDKRTKDGKEAAAAFAASAVGRTVLSEPDYDMVIAMRDSSLAHPTANMLLTSKGVSEASIFFEIDGIKCRCRPDRIVDHEVFGEHILVDVKTVDDIDRIHLSLRDYRYYVQAAFYQDGYEQLTGHKPRFVFVAISKKRSLGRHRVRVFELPPDTVQLGREEYLADLEKVKELEAFGCGLEIETIDMAKLWK
jgi:exodeoxyribonuclease VIII